MAEFWSNPGTEPKRGYRWIMRFNINSPNAIDEWLIKSVNRPGWTLTESSHVFINHTFYYPGSVTWQEMTVTLVDPVEPDIAATLSDIVVGMGYSPPTDATNASLTSISKAKAANALGTVLIQQIDADGNALETWTLWNSFITDLKYGDLAYGEDDLTELTVTLAYDWARIETTNPSVAVSTLATGGTEFFGV